MGGTPRAVVSQGQKGFAWRIRSFFDDSGKEAAMDNEFVVIAGLMTNSGGRLTRDGNNCC